MLKMAGFTYNNIAILYFGINALKKGSYKFTKNFKEQKL